MCLVFWLVFFWHIFCFLSDLGERVCYVGFPTVLGFLSVCHFFSLLFGCVDCPNFHKGPSFDGILFLMFLPSQTSPRLVLLYVFLPVVCL